MILTTTPSVEGKNITEYQGIVFGEVIAGVDFIKDFTAGLSNFFGGRSGTYEEELLRAREEAMRELEERARALGARPGRRFEMDGPWGTSSPPRFGAFCQYSNYCTTLLGEIQFFCTDGESKGCAVRTLVLR